MTQYMYSTFDGVADTNLTLYSPDVGGADSWLSGGLPFELDGIGNVRTVSGSTVRYAYNTSAHDSENYTVSAKVVLNGTTGTNLGGVAARVQGDDTMYVAWIKGSGGFQLKLRDGTTGTGTDLVAEITGIPISASAVYTITLEVDGSTLTAKLVRDSDSAELVNISTTDSTLTTGDFGIVAYDSAVDIQEIDVNSIAPPPTTSYTTDIFVNNSGTPLIGQLVYWQWFPDGRAGSFNSVGSTSSSDITDSEGRLTISIPSGEGVVMASVRNSDAGTDYVYYEFGESI